MTSQSNNSDASSEKSTLRTSREIYHRIKWDPRYHATQFVIGYEERFSGIQETPLETFSPDGEIPWHRVWYIRKGKAHVWDRKERVDLLFGSGQTEEKRISMPWLFEGWNDDAESALENPSTHHVEAPHNKVARSNFVLRPTYRFDPTSSGWVACDTAPTKQALPVLSSKPVLRCLSWNVLFDLYETELIYTEERTRALLDFLSTQNVDVIGLIEVTDTFLEILLQEEWVQHNYVVSEVSGGHTIQPYGQVLLSRYPFQTWHHSYSSSKQVICAEFSWTFGSCMMALVHLSSNRERDAEQRRIEQIETLLSVQKEPIFSSIHDWFLMGDFNIRSGDRLESFLSDRQWNDLWEELNPTQRGDTFVPSHNPLAALSSRSGMSGRLDRWFLPSNSKFLVPKSLQLVGSTPYIDSPESHYYSDHVGLLGEFFMEQVEETNEAIRFSNDPVYQSALIVMPPEEQWKPIQAIREQHDKSFVRWMPHINLFFGFIPDSYFDEVAEVALATLKDFPSFEITLKEFRTFQHKKSTTVWLYPETHPPEALQQLHRRLQPLFPTCTQQTDRGDGVFHPHLTVGQFRNSEWKEAEPVLQSWRDAWVPITFTVDSVQLISRRDDDPFVVRNKVTFSQGEKKKITLSHG